MVWLPLGVQGARLVCVFTEPPRVVVTVTNVAIVTTVPYRADADTARATAMRPAVDVLRILTAVRSNRAAWPGVATAACANAVGAAAMRPAVDVLQHTHCACSTRTPTICTVLALVLDLIVAAQTGAA
jgi:hypothetical protein